MLAAENIGKKLGGRWIIKGFSFQILPGESLLVTGQNGTGKSTLLKLVAGLMLPTIGTLSLPEGDRAEIIGYSALDQNLYPALTAIEHLEMAREVRQLGSTVAEDLSALEQAGLAESKDVLVGAFSSGMRARLKFLLAIQHCPKILLLDEPSAALDDVGQKWLYEKVEQHLHGGICLIATNDKRDRVLTSHEVNLG